MKKYNVFGPIGWRLNPSDLHLLLLLLLPNTPFYIAQNTEFFVFPLYSCTIAEVEVVEVEV